MCILLQLLPALSLILSGAMYPGMVAGFQEVVPAIAVDRASGDSVRCMAEIMHFP